MVRVWGSQLAR